MDKVRIYMTFNERLTFGNLAILEYQFACVTSAHLWTVINCEIDVKKDITRTPTLSSF